MTRDRIETGRRGEAAAAAWYRARGYEVVEQNWRTRTGEIDLVVAREDLIVFCEVKTRSTLRYGTPAEAVTVRKQRRLRGLAAEWLRRGPRRRVTTRFDVAAVRIDSGQPVVEVIERAF